jgi:maleylacetoacetate isomerase
MAQPQKVILYSYWRSSSAWRVRNALNIKKIPYEYRAVHLVKGEQKSPEYLKLNPQGLVPCLVVDSNVLTQSVAIIEYLEEVYPNPPLLPRDPLSRAKVRSLTHMITSDIQPIQNLRVLQKIGDENKKKEWAAYWIEEGFKALEAEVKQTTKDGCFCYGDSITMADIVLVPQVANAYRYGVDMKKFPTIDKIYQYVSKLEAIQNADPYHQPDTPPEAHKK